MNFRPATAWPQADPGRCDAAIMRSSPATPAAVPCGYYYLKPLPHPSLPPLASDTCPVFCHVHRGRRALVGFCVLRSKLFPAIGLNRGQTNC